MKSGNACPAFFTITTGDKEVPLWVRKKSHMLAAYGFEPNSRVDVTKMMIPPYSIAIRRGDVMHAGASFEDSRTNDVLLRYHLYFVPSTLDLPDGVYVDTTFKPHLFNSPKSEGVNLITDIDAESEEPAVTRKRNRTGKKSDQKGSKKQKSNDDMQQLMDDVFGSDNEN